MLLFFRRIRKQLAKDNKFFQYSRYAIGEIILVVVGILIALQINNWNDWRKERYLELEYMNNLKTEIKHNIEYLKRHIQFNVFQFDNVDILLGALSGDTLYSNTEPLVVAIEHVGWHMTADPYLNDVWLELLNNKNTRLIMNDSLRTQLTSHYSSLKHTQNLESVSTEFNSGYRRLVGDVLSPALRETVAINLRPWSYNGHIEAHLPEQKALEAGLKGLSGLNGYLADIKMFRRTLILILNMIDLDAENTLNLLEREIENHPYR